MPAPPMVWKSPSSAVAILPARTSSCMVSIGNPTLRWILAGAALSKDSRRKLVCLDDRSCSRAVVQSSRAVQSCSRPLPHSHHVLPLRATASTKDLNLTRCSRNRRTVSSYLIYFGANVSSCGRRRIGATSSICTLLTLAYIHCFN